MTAKTGSKAYYIMDHCIACTTCSTVSPQVFSLDVSRLIAVVRSQPTNPVDDAKSFSALKCCPVSAIGQVTQ
jgi:ferredoxin